MQFSDIETTATLSFDIELHFPYFPDL